MGDLSSLGNIFSTGMQDVGNFLGGGAGAASAIPDITSSVPDFGSALGSGTVNTAAQALGTGAGMGGGALSAANFGTDALANVPDVSGALPSVTGINTAVDPLAAGVNANPTLAGIVNSPSLMSQAGQDWQSVTNPVQMNTSVGPLAPGIGPVDANPYGTIGAPTGGQILGGAGNFLQNLFKNPAAMKALTGLGLGGIEMLMGNKQVPGMAAAQQMAAGQGQFAKTQGELAMAEQQGMLPAGAQGLFQGVLNAQMAAIRAKYASMGMTGSTAEMQDLNAARENVMQQILQQGQTMANTAWANVKDATGIQSSLLDKIMEGQISQQQNMAKILAELGGASADAFAPTSTSTSGG